MAEEKKFEHKERRGFFSKNRYKKETTHPSYTGLVMINGAMERIAIWERKTAKGNIFYSFTLTPKQETVETDEKLSDTPEQTAAQESEPTSELPF